MDRAVDNTTADRNRAAADIEHLFIQSVGVDHQIAAVKYSLDRVFDRLPRRLLAAVLSDEPFEIVPRLAEDVMAPIGIIHVFPLEITPSAGPAPARR
jgi:hypothetical protein